MANSTNVRPGTEELIVEEAMEAVAQIDQEAQQRKLQQTQTLETACQIIRARMKELGHQLAELEGVLKRIRGKPASEAKTRERRDLTDLRNRLSRWMEARKGQRLGAGDLVREFPELNGTPVSMFLKPLIQSGKVKTDATDGLRRMKYFAS